MRWTSASTLGIQRGAARHFGTSAGRYTLSRRSPAGRISNWPKAHRREIRLGNRANEYAHQPGNAIVHHGCPIRDNETGSGLCLKGDEESHAESKCLSKSA
jgi:hypothetical protein